MSESVFDENGRRLDQIQVRGITARGRHGVLEQEKTNGQVFVVDVVLHLNTAIAARSDRLDDAVDYSNVAEKVVAIITGEPFDLIETMAERIADSLLQDDRVVTVDVDVHKPNAPIAVRFSDVVVSVRRPIEHSSDVKSPSSTSASSAPQVMLSPVDLLIPFRGPRSKKKKAAKVVDVPVEAELVDTDTTALVLPDLPQAAVEAPVAEAPETPEEEPVSEAIEPSVDPLDEAPEQPVQSILALGANLGPIQQTLRQAIVDIDKAPGVRVDQIAPLARTAPEGDAAQPFYLNTVIEVTTILSPRELLKVCAEVEVMHGRTRPTPKAPRTLDIDLITFNDLVASSEDLEVPHPRAFQRAFVLLPWSEMDPEAVLPGFGGGLVGELAASAQDIEGVRYMALDWFDDSTLGEPEDFGDLDAEDVEEEDIAEDELTDEELAEDELAEDEEVIAEDELAEDAVEDVEESEDDELDDVDEPVEDQLDDESEDASGEIDEAPSRNAQDATEKMSYFEYAEESTRRFGEEYAEHRVDG